VWSLLSFRHDLVIKDLPKLPGLLREPIPWLDSYSFGCGPCTI
jgi:hypothetical protein